MARRVVLWRILRRMLRIVECETSLFWIEGGGGSVEQELGENWHSRDRIEPDGSRGVAWALACDKRARVASTGPSQKELAPSTSGGRARPHGSKLNRRPDTAGGGPTRVKSKQSRQDVFRQNESDAIPDAGPDASADAGSDAESDANSGHGRSSARASAEVGSSTTDTWRCGLFQFCGSGALRYG